MTMREKYLSHHVLPFLHHVYREKMIVAKNLVPETKAWLRLKKGGKNAEII